MVFDLPSNRFLGRLSGLHPDSVVRDAAPLVSISGGQDSILLAWSLFLLQSERRLSPIWLYHNHLWHAEGFHHGLHCIRLAFIFGWSFIDTVPFQPIFEEEVAWDFRQRLRGRLCAFYGTEEVFLGHTKTDQIESLLFHLFRGSLRTDSILPRAYQRSLRPLAAPVIESLPASLFLLEGTRTHWTVPTRGGGAWHFIQQKGLI